MKPGLKVFALQRILSVLAITGLGGAVVLAQNKINCVPPTIIAGGTTTICNGQSAAISVTVSSGSAPYTYQWSPSGSLINPNSSNPVASPTTTTTYTIFVTDNQPCTSAPAFVTITVNSTPTITVTGTNTICNGQSTTLTANGANSYVWSPSGSLNNPNISNPVATPSTSTNYTVTGTNASNCTSTATYSVTVNPLPTANAGPDVSICPGSSTTLNGSGNGTFLWSPSTNLSCTTCPNPVADPSITITYTLSVTNGCGTAIDSVTVTSPALPSVNAGPDVTICLGANTPLLAIGSGTFLWSPSQGLSCTSCPNPIANPTVSTNYTVTITASCGTASDSVWVIVDVPLATVSGTTPICSGNSSTLTATGGGTYLWNPGNSTNPVIVVSPTISTGYTVTITDSFGCKDSDTMTVIVNPLPATSISGNTTICSGQSSTLTASGGGTYAWDNGSSATSIIVSPSSPTSYTVTATNAFGCTKSATITVNVTPQPTASVTATSTTLCSGNTTSLNASGGNTYVWSPSQGLNFTNISNPIATVTTGVTYTVIVSNGACADTATIAIAVNVLPIVTVNPITATICNGNCDSLFASGGSSYMWAPGGIPGSAIKVCPTITTSYTVTGTDLNGCTDTAVALINVIPPVNAQISGDSVLCAGDVTLLIAQGGGTYAWNTGAMTSSISVNPTANTGYTVTVSNGACSDTASVNVIVFPVPTADASALPYTINIGNHTTLTGITSTGTYTWTPATGLSCSTCANPVASPTATTTYTLTTVSDSGCTAMDTVIVNVNLECEEIFVPTAFSPNNDGHNDTLFVRNPCILEMEFNVYDRWGQIVFYTNDKTRGWDGTFHGKLMDPAVFFYTLSIKFITNTEKYITGNVTLVR